MTEDPLLRLKTLGRVLDGSQQLPENTKKIQQEPAKACLIIINLNTVFRKNLGICPLNDAVTCASAMKEFDFENYILKNPSRHAFLSWLDYFISKTSKHLVIFYTGHLNGVDPFTFGDESVSNQLFLDHIQNLSGRLTLISDVCKKSSIWDISHSRLSFPPGVVSFSAIADEERPHHEEEKGQRGFFMTQVAKWLGKKPDITPKDLSFALRKVMKKNGYSFVVGTSSEDLLLLPLFE